MKIESTPETGGARGSSSETVLKKPRRQFAEVLEETRDTKTLISPFTTATLPFSPMCDVAPVDAGYSIAAPDLEPLLTSLVEEIVIQAPPAGETSVDIQFDSRTLEGL